MLFTATIATVIFCAAARHSDGDTALQRSFDAMRAEATTAPPGTAMYTRTRFQSTDCSGFPAGVGYGIGRRCAADNSLGDCRDGMCEVATYETRPCTGLAVERRVVLGGYCVEGADGSTMWAIGNTTTVRVGDGRCPSGDVHKLECAAAIAKCAVSCLGGIASCVACIAANVLAGDVKICCQTLSYYVGFACSDCNFAARA